MSCDSCRSTDTRTEECEADEEQPAYTATICNACGWRSDWPPMVISHGHEIAPCENCHLRIRDGEFVYRFADDVVIHHECPGAQA